MKKGLLLYVSVLFSGIQLQYTGCLNIHWTELTPGTAHRCVDTNEFSAYEEYFNSHRVLSEPGLLIVRCHMCDEPRHEKICRCSHDAALIYKH